jgi:UDP-glucose:(heptosyl)LPS alpha-1,3-glucosyltransferase
MMRIAFIRKKYVFHGGAESFSQNFIQGLASQGHEIHIFAIKWQTDKTYKNIFFHKIPAITFNSFLRDLSFAISTYLFLRRKGNYFDVIQSHDKTIYQDIYRAGDGCHIAWLKRRFKRSGFFGKISIILNPYHWLILMLEKMIFTGHKYKKIIAISEFVKKDILKYYDVDDKDIEVIYNGVDTTIFNFENKNLFKKEIRKKYSTADDDIVLLFVGSGFYRKGLEFLLRAAELVLKPVTIYVVGSGSVKKYQKIVKRQNVIFCGPQKEINKYYAAADIFVFPTLYEPFGNVHLEALASGLPVITTRFSGAAEIIDDGIHGFVVSSPEDYHAIAEKITFLVDDKDLRELMGKNAVELAERFSIERNCEAYLNVYKKLILQNSVPH